MYWLIKQLHQEQFLPTVLLQVRQLPPFLQTALLQFKAMGPAGIVFNKLFYTVTRESTTGSCFFNS